VISEHYAISKEEKMAEATKENTKVDLPVGEEAGRKPLLTWDSAEFVHYKKDQSWFVIAGLAGLVIAAGLYYFGQLSGAIVVVVATVVFSLISIVKPKSLHCEIYDQGILIEKKPYKYEQFKTFWITTGEIPKIKLQQLGKFSAQVVLPLQNVDADQVRAILKKHLPEDEAKGEDLGDFFNRFLRF
jgi:hypothetical protein